MWRMLTKAVAEEAEEIEIEGRTLSCPICRHHRFWTRRSLLNTRWLSYIGFDWAARDAITVTCERCGHILWFADR